MRAPATSAFTGSSIDTSLPRRSAPMNDARWRTAPDRSTSRRTASSKRVPVRSASRIRTSTNDAFRRSAPRRATSDQSPPSTVSAENVHPVKTLPTSLQRLNVVSKNRDSTNVQLVNAASIWVEPLKRTSRNVQSTNEALRSRRSVRSVSANSTASNCVPDSDASPHAAASKRERVAGRGAASRRSAITSDQEEAAGTMISIRAVAISTVIDGSVARNEPAQPWPGGGQHETRAGRRPALVRDGRRVLLVDHRPAVPLDAPGAVVRSGARDLRRGAQLDLVVRDVGVVDCRGEDELVEPAIGLHGTEVRCAPLGFDLVVAAVGAVDLGGRGSGRATLRRDPVVELGGRSHGALRGQVGRDEDHAGDERQRDGRRKKGLPQPVGR